MDRIRTGVIGVGTIAQIMHLPYLRELDDRFEIAALCDVDSVALEDIGRQYGVSRLFASADDLLAEPLDAVLILTSGDHAPATIAALERGLHVLVEKPLAYTLRETDEVLTAAARAGTTLLVGMMKQYDPGYQRGVELVHTLRDLRYVDATTLQPENTLYMFHHPIARESGWPPALDETYGAEMFLPIQRAILASGSRDLVREGSGSDDPAVQTAYLMLIGSSIHDINALRGALGQPESVVSSHVWAGGTSFTATLAYANDVRANYTWTLLPYVKHYVETFAFYASDGRVLIRFPSPYLRNEPTLVDVERMHGEELHVTRLTASYEEAFKRELIEFDECVRTGRSPRTDGAGFRQDLEVLAEIARKFADLSDESLAWTPGPGFNSIGAILYHLALIEADWLYAEVLEIPYPPEAAALFPRDVRDADDLLTAAQGETLAQLMERLDAVRELLLDAFRGISAAEFRRVRSLPGYDVTPEYVLHHLMQHEAEHRGEMGMLRALSSRGA